MRWNDYVDQQQQHCDDLNIIYVGERSVRSCLVVVELPMNCAKPARRSNFKSWDWVHRNSVTLENLKSLLSVEYDRCDLVNSLNQLSAAYKQLLQHNSKKGRARGHTLIN